MLIPLARFIKQIDAGRPEAALSLRWRSGSSEDAAGQATPECYRTQEILHWDLPAHIAKVEPWMEGADAGSDADSFC